MQRVSIQFNDEWKSPNADGFSFSSIPEKSGVYVFVGFKKINFSLKYSGIVYIGSSRNLLQRYEAHDVIGKIDYYYDYYQFYFKETINYIAEEKMLIRTINPRFNKAYKTLRYV